MKDLTKLPKWAQRHIQELEQRANDAEQYTEALRVMIDGSPEIEPDVLPPELFSGEVRNGWLAYRGDSLTGVPRVNKACTSSIYHSVGQWDKTTSQNSKALYSSPVLALKSLLPKILKAYADEIATTLKKIKDYE